MTGVEVKELTVPSGRRHSEDNETRGCTLLAGLYLLAKGPSPAASQIPKPVPGTRQNQPRKKMPFYNSPKSTGYGPNEHSLLPGEYRIQETSGGVKLRAILT